MTRIDLFRNLREIRVKNKRVIIMFSKITTIAWKDAIIRFSSRSELLFFLVLPLVFIFLLGGGLTGGEGKV